MEKDDRSTNSHNTVVSDLDLSEFDPLKNVNSGFNDNFSSTCTPKPPPRVKRSAPPPPQKISKSSEIKQLPLKENHFDSLNPDGIQAKRHNSLINHKTNFEHYSDDMDELVENLRNLKSTKSASMTANSHKTDKYVLTIYIYLKFNLQFGYYL